VREPVCTLAPTLGPSPKAVANLAAAGAFAGDAVAGPGLDPTKKEHFRGKACAPKRN